MFSKDFVDSVNYWNVFITSLLFLDAEAELRNELFVYIGKRDYSISS